MPYSGHVKGIKEDLLFGFGAILGMFRSKVSHFIRFEYFLCP